jgi:N-methylhydantoinase B/oxoprolinase/acetone carboxylase alpha subunit
MQSVFRRERLVGYTMCITHLPDIGGIAYDAAATDIFLEGLRLLICKLARAGQVDRFILDLIRSNCRVSDQTIGDVMANITCNEVGGRQPIEFMDDYGLDDLMPLSRAIRNQAESAMWEKIRAWPDSTYSCESDVEGIDETIRLACTVTVEGDGVGIDFGGTRSFVLRGINVPFCYTRATANYAIKCLTVPSIPNNEGAVAPIIVAAPEGCVLNALPPRLDRRPASGRPFRHARHLQRACPGRPVHGSGRLRHDQRLELPRYPSQRPPDLDTVFRDGRLWRVGRPGGCRDHAGPEKHGRRVGGGMGNPDLNDH